MILYYKRLTTLIILTGLSILFTALRPSEQNSLEIKILNVGKKGGKIVVEIYSSKTGWLESPYRKMVTIANQDFKTASFQVPYGKYAISVYQDINDNGKLDYGIFGIPKEPIGFGNNYKPFGKPKYEAALIEFNDSSKPHEIKLFTVF